MPASDISKSYWGDCHQSLSWQQPTLTLLQLSSYGWNYSLAPETARNFPALALTWICNELSGVHLYFCPHFCSSSSGLVSSHQAVEMDFWPLFHSYTLLEILISAQLRPSSAPLLRDYRCFFSGVNKVQSGDLGIWGQGKTSALVSYQPVSPGFQGTFSKPGTVSFFFFLMCTKGPFLNMPIPPISQLLLTQSFYLSISFFRTRLPLVTQSLLARVQLRHPHLNQGPHQLCRPQAAATPLKSMPASTSHWQVLGKREMTDFHSRRVKG